MKRGLLIIFSGPSGVGKGTIREEIIKDKSLNLFFSVSMTTRKPRAGEIDGEQYYFVSREEFDKNVKEGNLLEWAEFVGNCYGTPKNKVDEKRNKGKNVLLEIEVNGAGQVINKLKNDEDVLTIFIAPPSFEELEKRIRGRSTEPEDVIMCRLNKAKSEFPLSSQYQHVVINDDLQRASNEIIQIIKSRMK